MSSYYTCPYWRCPNRNELGYCKTTVCINPEFQQYNMYSTDSTVQQTVLYTTDHTVEVSNVLR